MYMLVAHMVSMYEGSMHEVRKKVINSKEMSYVVKNFYI